MSSVAGSQRLQELVILVFQGPVALGIYALILFLILPCSNLIPYTSFSFLPSSSHLLYPIFLPVLSFLASFIFFTIVFHRLSPPPSPLLKFLVPPISFLVTFFQSHLINFHLQFSRPCTFTSFQSLLFFTCCVSASSVYFVFPFSLSFLPLPFHLFTYPVFIPYILSPFLFSLFPCLFTSPPSLLLYSSSSFPPSPVSPLLTSFLLSPSLCTSLSSLTWFFCSSISASSLLPVFHSASPFASSLVSLLSASFLLFLSLFTSLFLLSWFFCSSVSVSSPRLTLSFPARFLELRRCISFSTFPAPFSFIFLVF